MSDIGPNDLDRANDIYNARLDAAGVPDGGVFVEVPGGLLHADLFDEHDVLSMVEALAVSYQQDDEETFYPDSALGKVAQVAVHSIAIGTLAERERGRRQQRRLNAAMIALGVIARGTTADAQEFARLTLEGLEGGGNGAE